MDSKTGFAASQESDSSTSAASSASADSTASAKREKASAEQRADRERRLESDRRAFTERRRNSGIFEVRARRDSSGYDRRRGERRLRGRSWFNFWRRDG